MDFLAREYVNWQKFVREYVNWGSTGGLTNAADTKSCLNIHLMLNERYRRKIYTILTFCAQLRSIELTLYDQTC